MKLNNKIKVLVISGVLTFSNLLIINANDNLGFDVEEVINNKEVEQRLDKGDKEGKKRGGLRELKEEGILDDNDIANIKKYMEENKDDIKKEMYERKVKEIDKMVSEKVISKEKGEALKNHIKERFESGNTNK